MFSGRIHWELEENELARVLARMRAAGERICDLTGWNPTRAGLHYPADELLSSLAAVESLVYEPDPRGMHSAREAVGAYYREHKVDISPENVVLTASTSEGYGFLFKLLAEPGDEILVPRPSYPLFDFLASLEGVRPKNYPLRYDGGWQVDFRELEASLNERSRAVVVVHPNNPTGSYVSAGDRERLLALAAERELALIVDEVFLDFPLGEGTSASSFAGQERGLVFVLSGLSKLAGLPQMKLSWIVVSGDRARVEQASLRLEHIGDTYLSVGTPVQVALRRFFEIGGSIRRLISERTRQNLALITQSVGTAPAMTLLVPEGGWYASIRLPAIRSAEEWALQLLEKQSVYVHPGNFFGFEMEAVLVASLLTPTDELSEGMHRIVSGVAAEIRS